MKISIRRKFRLALTLGFLIPLSYFIINGIRIYAYSSNYSEKKSDVAIVLGAGSSSARLSPVFRERINHSIYLYKKKVIKTIILTGGYGEGQTLPDSEVAKIYLLAHGIPEKVILTETNSRYTIENLQESRHLMDSLGLESALIVSDPLHMKRSVDLAQKLGIRCNPSPTRTTMYRSFFPKAKSLLYESFYYSLGEIAGKN